MRTLADSPEQAVCYGVIKRGAVQAVGQPPGTDIVNKLIKGVVFPVMRGKDRYAAAPHEQREGRLHQFVQVVHKGSFVNNDAPLLGPQGTGLGGQAPHAEAGGKADAVHRDIPVSVAQHSLLHVVGQHV